MTRGVEIRAVDAPSPNARVCHYDQLDEHIKGRFPELIPADDAGTVVDAEDPEAFGACDVVKFTRYYRVSPTSDGPACD